MNDLREFLESVANKQTSVQRDVILPDRAHLESFSLGMKDGEILFARQLLHKFFTTKWSMKCECSECKSSATITEDDLVSTYFTAPYDITIEVYYYCSQCGLRNLVWDSDKGKCPFPDVVLKKVKSKSANNLPYRKPVS